MRFSVVCSVRNEGPFLVEWVSWYRRLGFDDIVVVTNDCTDRSPQLLDALQNAGWITHLRHDPDPGQSICAQKLAAAKKLPQVNGADWLLVCDVDEFLTIHIGDGTIRDLIPRKADFLAMAINWRVFGTSGHARWEEGLTHRQFTKAATIEDESSSWIKMIHAHPRWFRALGEHGPKRLSPKRSAEWGNPKMRVVNASFDTIPDWTPDGDYLRRLPADLVRHHPAQMNHYMLRSAESFDLKRGTLSAVAGKNRYTESFFIRHNRNDVEDLSAMAHANAFDAVFAQAMALPDVARLHHLCCVDFLTRSAAKQGRAVENDPRFHQQIARAAAAHEAATPDA